MNEKQMLKKEVIGRYPLYDISAIDVKLEEALQSCNKKIIVLDDDPTGIQTVHGIYVYTDWAVYSIEEGFDEDNSIFFILTNSRGFTKEKTEAVHKEIASNIIEVASKKGKDYLIISRSDSTLRGYYPLETETLKRTIEEKTGKKYDGEIIFPFFMEGGRYTEQNTHYVQNGDILVPAGETEFAKDKTFGYSSSNLGEWIEEKTKGEYKKADIEYISVDELRNLDYDGIYKKLISVTDFNKIVVNALDYGDVKVFVIALIRAINDGKNFIFRSAASLTKVIGGISDKPLLTKDELIDTTSKNGGLIIIGSHVKKTTVQLENIKKCDFIKFIEFNQHLVVYEEAFNKEFLRVVDICEHSIKQGRTVAVYTRRERFDLNTGNKEDELKLAVKISDALSGIVSHLNVRPAFIIAKGGITSSDVGIKGLRVRKALVLGQILPGVPVWLTGKESKFPGMPFVIFPGNVGSDTALLEVVTIMS